MSKKDVKEVAKKEPKKIVVKATKYKLFKEDHVRVTDNLGNVSQYPLAYFKSNAKEIAKEFKCDVKVFAHIIMDEK